MQIQNINIQLITRDSDLSRKIQSILSDYHAFTISEIFDISFKPEIIIADLDTAPEFNHSKLPYNPLFIALTRERGSRHLIESMTFGAFDCQIIPLDEKRFKDSVNKAYKIQSEIKIKTRSYLGEIEGSGVACAIVGDSSMLQEVCKLIGQMGRVDVPVLITGESGTGKELVAESIWKVSTRWENPFVTINCAAIPETLLEAELFGYEKGAFTGAGNSRIGKFEEADGGIVFLDEIGDMPLSLQAKVLRVLQNSTFHKLGDNKDIKVNIRIIAATNKNLEELVEQGKFRDDLYFRINVIKLNLPSLNERPEDIPLLAECFIRRYGPQMGKAIKGVTEQFIEKLVNYSWPGNVRELENTIRKAIALSKTNYLTSFDLELIDNKNEKFGNKNQFIETVKARTRSLIKTKTGIYNSIIKEIEPVILNQVLEAAKNNQSKASRLLGISRLTLRKKLEEYDLV
ncbi:MAG: sigma-54 interaction domain-containing protein [Thermodesulfobacteriota bacterium]